MKSVYVATAVLFFAGSVLVLERIRPLRRSGLGARVRPYVAPTTSGNRRLPGGAAVTAVMAPLAEVFGNLLANAMGIHTPLDARLARAGREQTPGEFRLSQLTGALAALGATSVAVLLVGPPAPVSIVLLLGAPVLVALLAERRLETEASARAEIVSLELPVVAEQLGILLGSGLSLGAALDRIARRSDGLVATELANVVREVRRGRTETEALRDWARLADSQGVDRLVSVLSLHRDASDLGALISTEARAIRDASHRALVETIEKRAQLVWVPVTVATLVPGLILIGVPFVRAMSAVAG